MRSSVRLGLVALLSLPVCLSGCRKWRFPEQPPDYREFAYVTNAGAGTVSVLDLVSLQPAGVLRVGGNPSAIVANPRRNELYVVNTAGNSISVIDAVRNQVSATIPVRRQPFDIALDPEGQRGYVPNAGASSMSVVDLKLRREIAVVAINGQPVAAAVSPDARSLIVSDRKGGKVFIFGISRDALPSPRATFDGCAEAGDIAVLPDSTKAFITCSGSNSVLALSLAAAPGSWPAKQDANASNDHLLARLRVGKSPVHLALKPDGGEIFVSNSGSNNISEISTQTNEVGGSYPIGNQPVFGLVTTDNSTLWVSNAGADSLSLYSIDDGRLTGSIRTGPQPEALAFSSDEHLLLAADRTSGDVAVIRTHDRNGPTLFTMLPAGARPSAIAIKAFRQGSPEFAGSPAQDK